MYAVIRTGGKQYRVQEGDVIEVDHLSVKGNRVSFTPVLVVTDDGKTIFGRKELKAYAVGAKVVGDAKGDKINVLKYRPKSGYATRTGHRQLFSLIEIASIGERGTKKTEPREGGDDAAVAPEPSAAENEPSESENAGEAEGK